MKSLSERYSAAVKAASVITSKKALTISMVADAADAAGVDGASWFQLLASV